MCDTFEFRPSALYPFLSSASESKDSRTTSTPYDSASSRPITAFLTSSNHSLSLLVYPIHYERNPLVFCTSLASHFRTTLGTDTTFSTIHPPLTYLLPWVITPSQLTLSSLLWINLRTRTIPSCQPRPTFNRTRCTG